MNLGRNITHECLLSQSASVLSSFKCSPMMVCLKKMFNGEIICYLKRDWKDCVITSEGLIQIIAKFRTEKKLCTFLSSTIPVILLRGGQYSWKGTNWKFIFPWRKTNWHVLQIAKVHFSYTIWIMISEKSIMAYMSLHHDGASHVPKGSANKKYKKNCLKKFPILLTFNYYLYVYLWFL